ncbi:MAG: glycosyltransferase [Acidimicrobiales bacterium]|nr:glycosyltransferase [Acidimicrobiales bacterium]
MSERILVVSPYPPERDGLGAYAVQQVRALRRAGNHVEVCSPRPSAAHHHLDLVGPTGARALARLARGFDRVIVHFHPDIFYAVPSTPTSRISTGVALAKAFRSMPPVEIRLHEVDARWASASEQVEASTRSGFLAEGVFAAAARATRSVFRGAAEITVHDAGHRDLMVEAFGVRPDRVRVVEHGADFAAHTTVDRATARRSLGLPDDEHVFVCIGFVQPHKGFDRAAAAFRGLGAKGASLHIVGSVRVDDPAAAEHQRELEALEAQIPGVHLHLGYVSDELFDRWIVAGDTVVLPYRHIWSSGVAERARLHQRPVIATRVGGLAEQLDDIPGSVLVDDNAGLAAAILAAVKGGTFRSADTVPATDEARAGGWSFDGAVDRDAVMAEVHRRSAALRGVKVDPTAGTRAPRKGEGSAAVPLRRLRHVPLPPATSARPGVSTVKKLIRRVIAWEVDPLRDQVTRLHEAAIQAAETTDARLEHVEHEVEPPVHD